MINKINEYMGWGPIDWAVIFVLIMIVVAILIVLTRPIDNTLTYELININGMPCIVTDGGISCDWSKYD